jgi:hypothetical protein
VGDGGEQLGVLVAIRPMSPSPLQPAQCDAAQCTQDDDNTSIDSKTQSTCLSLYNCVFLEDERTAVYDLLFPLVCPLLP